MSTNRDIPDVCIVGAGLAGSIIAYELGRSGVKVIILEAGPRHDLKARFSYMEKHLNGENPWTSDNPQRDAYTNAGEIKYPLNGYRVKAVGGTTLHWGGLTLRLHETDFRMKSLYGIADDWPISYEELETYYGKAEIALGVAGIADNPFASYRSTGYPLAPFPFSYAVKEIKKGCDKLGIKIHHVPYARNSIPYEGRPACQAFATCAPVCPIEAQYNAGVHIRLAEGTGNVKVIPNANVVRINLNSSGRVNSVIYANPDRSEYEQKARVFVLAAHAVESARLLLLSKSGRFPYGLANNSGMIGKDFMEHLFVPVYGKLKKKLFPFRIGFHTAESHQFYITEKRDKIGAFKLEFWDSGLSPSDIAVKSGNWGAELKREVQESFGYDAGINAFLDQLPDRRNSITLDSSIKDYFGNPVPCLTYSINDYEGETIKRALTKIEEIFDSLAATQIGYNRFTFCGHHMGTCRMGNNPETSVVNPNLRAHDVDNLFIVGSGVFVTGGAVNPSLTIAALSMRAAEYILKEGSKHI